MPDVHHDFNRITVDFSMSENRLKRFETSPLSCFSTGVIRCGEFLHTSRDNGAVQEFGWQVQSINDKSEYIIITY